ncbi:MAG TPA: BTAD domain-containing putative transcriptional regulator [Pilimelia sp.]|nr:BTAD domain-containing putative transcriptional regulator [Pilimelia sp.]
MDTPAADASVGALVRSHRRRFGLSQQELGRRSGISVRALRDIEQDRVRRPHLGSVHSLASALGLTEADRDQLLAAAGAGAARAQTPLWVGVLGPLSVARGGRVLDIRTAAQRGLLGLLAVRANEPVPRDEIVRVLWGARPPKTWATQVHMAVGQLRKIVEPQRIQLDRTAYVLRLGTDQLDLSRFASLTSRARSLHDGGMARAALDLLDEAMRYWRGPVLSDAGSRLRDHPAVIAANQQRLAAALLLADIAIDLCRHEQALAALRSLVQDEPYHEGLQARLMLALAGHGERAAALRLFADVRRRLVEELGVEPARELQAVHLRVLRDEVQRNDVQRNDVPPHRPALLPPDVPDFTGREAQANLIRGVLTGDPAGGAPPTALAVLAIAGMAGVGKTALAVHAAHRAAGSYPDGQLYVNLRGAEAKPLDPADVLARFLRALGVDSRAIPDDPAERAALYRSRLAGRRVLVVLDNAASEAQVRPLLPGAASCAVVVTSRTCMTGVEGVRLIELDVFSPGEGLRLLARVADHERVAAQRDDAVEIVRLCGFLPLAVRVAGARLAARPTWRLAHLAGLLSSERQRLDQLATGDLAVRASLALSYQGLDGRSRRLYRLLGLFDTPDFPCWLAAAVLESPVDQARTHLEALVDAQLLTIGGTDVAGQHRYRFHDLVRLYAREQAEREDDPGSRAAAITRGMGGWLAMAEIMAEGVPGPCYAVIHGAAPRPPIDWAAHGTVHIDPLTWFDAERTALLSVVRQAGALGMDELAFDLAGCLEKYFDIRGMYADWRGTNEKVVAACRASGNLRGEAVMLRGLIDVVTWNSTGEAAMARLHADAVRLLEMFTELDDQRGIADAAVICSWGLVAQGAYEDAVETAARALRLAEESGHLGGQARAHVALALAYGENRQIQTAVEHLKSALIPARAIGHARYEATVLQFLGMAYREGGDFEASQCVLEESLAISRRYRDNYTEALTMLALARLYLRTCDPRATIAAQASLALGREYNMTHHIADSLAVLGELELAAGRTAEAIGYLDESVRLWRTRGWPSFLAATLSSLGDAYRDIDAQAARAAWSEARDLFAKVGNDARADELTRLLDRADPDA